MRVTKTMLRRLIKEELQNLQELNNLQDLGDWMPLEQWMIDEGGAPNKAIRALGTEDLMFIDTELTPKAYDELFEAMEAELGAEAFRQNPSIVNFRGAQLFCSNEWGYGSVWARTSDIYRPR